MSSTLYRKYRPKNFSEVIGQKHIVQTLSNAIKNDRVGQAYLFTGPRGTGKTSIARIFAKTINCENIKDADSCEKCDSCKIINEGKSLDIIEIDAASNTGVDNIRELRETINLPPTLLKYKVYIIDEVHMLSTGAFNALLKTLEEPPTHVVFILATTEIHKVPETIISRCQRFDFVRLPIQNIIEKLSLITKNEKIKIDKDSLEMIAIAAEGGMRDAESLLGQVIALEDKNITVKEVEEILGTADRENAAEISEKIITDDPTGAIRQINELLENGYDLQVFNKTVINYLRQLMLLKINPELKSSFSYELTGEQLEKILKQAEKAELAKIMRTINLLIDAQNKIASSMLPQLPLEIAIIKATHTLPNEQPETYSKQQIDKQSARPANTQAKSSELSAADRKVKIYPPEQELPSVSEDSGKKIDIYEVKNSWSKLLEDIRPYNHSLKALLSNCRIASVENNEIVLATPYDFYKEKLNDPANRLTVEQVFDKILGSKISIRAVTNKEAGIKDMPQKEMETRSEGVQDSLLNSALEIIGGKVVE